MAFDAKLSYCGIKPMLLKTSHVVSLSLMLATISWQAGYCANPSPSEHFAPARLAGHWIGTGLEIDGFGHPIELPGIVLDLEDGGAGRIQYPSLGCAGSLTRVGTTGTTVEYRESLTSGFDKCPSGATIRLRAVGNRLVFNWSVEGDHAGLDDLNLFVPSLPGTGPDGAWVRTGVLSNQAKEPADDAVSRNASDTVEGRIERIENGIVPAVIVSGEPVETVPLAKLMKSLNVPGVSVAVIHGGRIEWARAYGVTKDGGAVVTPNTLFQAASISKPITGVMTLRLVQDGKLNLDRDVGEYLKGWNLPRSESSQDRLITLRRLLTHTAGMTVHGFAGYHLGDPLPTLSQILNGEKPANSPPIRGDVTPGTQWQYSGGGYVVVRKVLEDVTGVPFPELARKLVLEPAGMTQSTFEQPLPASLAGEAAWPTANDGKPLKEGAHTYPELAPDGLWTTPTDLARFALGIQASLKGGSNALLSVPVARELLEPGGLANWGMGPAIGGRTRPYFWHSGSNAGFQSMMIAYNDGDGVVVMTNSDSGEKLASSLVRSVAYEYGWPDFQPERIAGVSMSPHELDQLCGNYRLGRFAILTVARQGNHLYASMSAQPKLPLLSAGLSQFRIYAMGKSEWFAIDPNGFTPDPNVQFFFSRDAHGNASQVGYRQYGGVTIAPRIANAEVDAIGTGLRTDVKAQSESPGSEEAMRDYLESLAACRPEYDRMEPAAAYVARQLLLNFDAEIAGLGTLQKLSFKGVGANGENTFSAEFQHGTALAEIVLSPDGKIEFAALLPPGYN